jgi:Flp pilus assembly protein protease CpaA
MSSHVEITLHAVTAALLVWGGVQDWQKREVSDWLTWPLFLAGSIAAIVRAARLDTFPLLVSIFVLTAWYFNWLGGADARALIGLWGLWPLAGLLGMACTGLWGLALVLRKRGKERIPALVAIALAACLTFLLEVAKIIP